MKNSVYTSQLVLSTIICIFFSNYCRAETNTTDHKKENKKFHVSNSNVCTNKPYGAQLDFTGYYFNTDPHLAGSLRGFFPLMQTKQEIIYTDLRGIVQNSGRTREGNAGFGYRRLFDNNEQMFGTHAYFDTIHTINNTNFNKISVGVEYWNRNLYLGTNFYMPIGARSVLVNSNTSLGIGFDQFGNIIGTLVTANQYDISLVGGDLSSGYQFSNNFTMYAGGFYYHSATKSVPVPIVLGPFIRARYSIFPRGRKIPLLNESTLEAQVQHDGTRKVVYYFGIRLTLASNKCELTRSQQHIVDPILRSFDFVELNQDTNSTTTFIIVPN